MDDDVNVKLLLYFIYRKEEITDTYIDEYRPSDCRLSYPFNLLTEDFIRCLKIVLNVRGVFVLHRWRTFFDTCYKSMLSSHMMYLKFIMFACISEENCINHIFEKFLSVCALIKLLSDETLQKTGVDLCDLNYHIMTVFFLSRLKINFCKRGGFRRFAEYVRNHRYLRWKLNENYSLSIDDPAAFFNATQIDLDEKLKKELKKDGVIEKKINPTEILSDIRSQRVAQLILDTTKSELPPLPNTLEPVLSTEAYKRKQMTKKTEEKRAASTEELEAMNVPLDGKSNSKSESITSLDANNQDNMEWCENIIQAVIKHNHSKCSNNKISSNAIQEKAEEILKHLKDTMESLCEVLAKYEEK